MRVLLVEDEARIAAFVRKGLAAEGIGVETATDGATGLALALAEPFDIMVLDIGLPVLDGFTVLDRLRAEGLERELPFSTVLAEPGPDGIGVWSRYPIAPGARQPGFRAGVVTTGLATPAGPVTMVAAHPLLPLHNAAESAAEAERLRGVLGSLPGPAPVVVAGDFNMTWDHTRFRALRSLGYVDSTEGGGDGPVPTWPHGRRLPGGLTVPPVIGIDHVLARGAARIGDTRTVEVAGTDHLGLRARVALPAGRDAPGGR